jgi:hypothetical protein
MTIPTPRGDERRVSLLAALDERYLTFVAGLPEPLRGLGFLRSTYTGEAGDVSFRGPSTLNPGVTLTPWLFWETTAPLDDETFLDLAEAGCLIVISSALLDHLVDGQADSAEDAVLLQRILHEGGIGRLRRRLGGASPFWPVADRLIAEHLEGLASEKAMRADPTRFTYPEFQRMVRVKFAPIVVTMAAYLAATDRLDLLDLVENSIKHLAVASQLLDDIGDWEQDHQAGRTTFFLASLGTHRPDDGPVGLSVEEVADRISATWLDVDQLNLAAGWLDRSRGSVEGISCPRWVEYLDGFRALTREHIRQTTAAHLARAVRPLLAYPEGVGAGEKPRPAPPPHP